MRQEPALPRRQADRIPARPRGVLQGDEGRRARGRGEAMRHPTPRPGVDGVTRHRGEAAGLSPWLIQFLVPRSSYPCSTPRGWALTLPACVVAGRVPVSCPGRSLPHVAVTRESRGSVTRVSHEGRGTRDERQSQRWHLDCSLAHHDARASHPDRGDHTARLVDLHFEDAWPAHLEALFDDPAEGAFLAWVAGGEVAA